MYVFYYPFERLNNSWVSSGGRRRMYVPLKFEMIIFILSVGIVEPSGLDDLAQMEK